MKVKTRREAEALIQSRVQTDPAFRQELMKDPKGVLAREFEVSLPPALKINVVEESDSNVFLVLPPPQVVKGELDESDLDRVAGGVVIAQAGKKISEQVGNQGSGPNYKWDVTANSKS